MSRSNRIAVTLWLVIVSLGSTPVASPQPPNGTPARYAGADVVVVDMRRLVETFEPFRKASLELRKEAAAGREKLLEGLRELEMRKNERLKRYAKGTAEYREEEAELWKRAMTIYRERTLFVQEMRRRNAEAFATSYSRIQKEIQHFQQEQRIGAVVNSGSRIEIPDLLPEGDSRKVPSIGYSSERGVLWWTMSGLGATIDSELERYELPAPSAVSNALPGRLPFRPVEFPDPMIPSPIGQKNSDVQEQVNQMVVAVSPELDITAVIEERLPKTLKEPGQAEPGVGADSR